MKTVKLNFKVNESTRNGRTYTKEEFIRAMDKRLSVNAYMYGYNSSEKSTLKDMIGRVTSYDIKENNDIMLSVSFVPNINEELFSTSEFSMSATGEVEEMKGVSLVTDLKINHFFVTPKGK